MKANKLWGIVFVFLCSTFVLLSCDEGDDNGSGKGLTGWYVRKSDLLTTADFQEINNAIINHEVLQDLGWAAGHHYITYADKDLFFYDDGSFNTSDAHFGRLRFSINGIINVYRIIDDHTIAFYIGWLYKENSSGTIGKEKIYTVYAGSMLGNLAYYLDEPTYYTYVRNESMLVVANGTIFTITSEGLIESGSSNIWTKYKPQ